jgi:hypothetical protein
LGWFDDKTHRELADDVTKFLQATVDHCILGLKILNQLVDELNIPTTGRTLTQHRKTSVSFRDVCLFKVFQLGLTTLKQLQTRAIGEYIGHCVYSTYTNNALFCVSLVVWDFPESHVPVTALISFPLLSFQINSGG